jgi:hypothetical protein
MSSHDDGPHQVVITGAETVAIDGTRLTWEIDDSRIPWEIADSRISWELSGPRTLYIPDSLITVFVGG